jgi:hypothetical protein
MVGRGPPDPPLFPRKHTTSPRRVRRPRPTGRCRANSKCPPPPRNAPLEGRPPGPPLFQPHHTTSPRRVQRPRPTGRCRANSKCPLRPTSPPGGTTSVSSALSAPPRHPPPARPEATPYRPLPRHFQKAAPLSHIALEGRPLPCSRLSEPYSSPSRKPARCALRAIFAGLPRHRTVPRLCRPLVPTNTLTPARQNHPPPKKCSTWNNHPLTHPSHAQIYQCPALSISGCQTFSLPHPPLL